MTQVSRAVSLSQLQFLFLPIVYGSVSSPVVITATGGITSHPNTKNIIFVAGNAPIDNIIATPQISAGLVVGQEMLLVGIDPLNYITLQNGNGLELNGPIVLDDTHLISLFWDGFNWREQYRTPS